MKKFILIVFVAVVAILAYAATRPNEFRYERSIDIHAPAAKIFPLVNTPRASRVWSPWERLDPDMKRSFSGSPSGVGAKYAWDGDEKIGAGNMEIIEVVPAKKVVSRLEFTRPLAAVNTTEFLLEEKDGVTHVTWAMYGPSNFMGKLVNIFIDCEKMVTDQFEKGLAELKHVVEQGDKAPRKPAGQPAVESGKPAD